MLIYEIDNQKWVIYDWEREDLLPDGSKLLARVKPTWERLKEVKECTLWELDNILTRYL